MQTCVPILRLAHLGPFPPQRPGVLSTPLFPSKEGGFGLCRRVMKNFRVQNHLPYKGIVVWKVPLDAAAKRGPNGQDAKSGRRSAYVIITHVWDSSLQISFIPTLTPLQQHSMQRIQKLLGTLAWTLTPEPLTEEEQAYRNKILNGKCLLTNPPPIDVVPSSKQPVHRNCSNAACDACESSKLLV